jgi:hypothetical protein
MNLIIKQLQDGNEKVFEQIVREYWPRMFKFALIIRKIMRHRRSWFRILSWYYGTTVQS